MPREPDGRRPEEVRHIRTNAAQQALYRIAMPLPVDARTDWPQSPPARSDRVRAWYARKDVPAMGPAESNMLAYSKRRLGEGELSLTEAEIMEAVIPHDHPELRQRPAYRYGLQRLVRRHVINAVADQAGTTSLVRILQTLCGSHLDLNAPAAEAAIEAVDRNWRSLRSASVIGGEARCDGAVVIGLTLPLLRALMGCTYAGDLR
jgi:hypothetical protein